MHALFRNAKRGLADVNNQSLFEFQVNISAIRTITHIKFKFDLRYWNSL